MTDGGLPASKKLKAADGSSAAAPVVAEDEHSGLLPPSIPVIQSANDLHAGAAKLWFLMDAGACSCFHKRSSVVISRLPATAQRRSLLV